ncbi:MAG: hypothetical protein ACPHQP_07560 [Longimicrobiales bacterium]
MTARLATHPDIAGRTAHVLERLHHAGVDVDFVGELDRSAPFAGLREHQIDLALVGVSAMRGSVSDEFTTVAVLPRMETRDVVVALQGRAMPLARLPAGATVGYTGARRGAFLAAHRSDLQRLDMGAAEVRAVADRARAGGKDDSGSAGLMASAPDALIMSALDAREAGLLDTAVEALDPKAWSPEPGQGALALMARHPIAEATALNHLPTRTALRTELALLDAIEKYGSETLGCLAQPSGRWIRLWAAAASPAGDRLVRSDLTGPLDEPESLGAAVASELVARGYRLLAGVEGS